MLDLNFDIVSSSSKDTIKGKLFKLTCFKDLQGAIALEYALIVKESSMHHQTQYGLYIYTDQKLYNESPLENKVLFPETATYLAENDIIKINSQADRVRTLYRKKANTNSFLVTENCNSFCLMCSQPPKKKDDSFLLKEIIELLPHIPKDCPEVGFTGGEPFLRGGAFIEVLRSVKQQLPHSSVHILSNGRLFKDINLARDLGSLEISDLMIGIPLYSDLSYVHDFIVQSQHAFTETIKGILNLKKMNVKVEIRFVIHKENYQSIQNFASFISRNFPFVDHVAFMGLENTGFAKHNHEQLWVDPIDYMGDLKESVLHLTRKGINVSIYNHQLCLIPFELYPNYRKSISDWKNEYFDECGKCSKIEHCGGFFSSTMSKSRALKAI
jgi:His-Xaa-Ser system radical SAM maturase HxsC